MTEVAAWVVHLPEDSAVVRALAPAHAAHTHELELLRQIEYRLHWLQWAKTKDAKRNRHQPEWFRFPWEPKSKMWQHDVLEWDEAAEKLGGDPRLAELMAKL